MTNKIHPNAIIGPQVELGKNNIIGPGAVIIGPCEIGDDNWIGPNAIIGTPGEYHDRKHGEVWETGSAGLVSIGSGNTIREFVTIQVSPDTKTSIANNCYFMTKSHIPHDAIVEDDVKIACAVLIGGYGHIAQGAYIGLGAITHQRIYVGAGAMVGMGSVVTKHVPPLAKFFGSPAKLRGFNKIKSEQFDLTESDETIFAEAYQSGHLPNSGSLSEKGNLLISEFFSFSESLSG
jgi:UDP-N-acetylglucosamine acyltransferase